VISNYTPLLADVLAEPNDPLCRNATRSTTRSILSIAERSNTTDSGSSPTTRSLDRTERVPHVFFENDDLRWGDGRREVAIARLLQFGRHV
jgi:hypothetical protein